MVDSVIQYVSFPYNLRMCCRFCGCVCKLLVDHPNVVKEFCSFVVERSLWVVMPFMAEGSCLHLMKIAYPEGFENAAIGSVLKETLKALEYLHRQGHIHRDVKAGIILLDSNGIVKLADFGVSACMFEAGDKATVNKYLFRNSLLLKSYINDEAKEFEEETRKEQHQTLTSSSRIEDVEADPEVLE